MHAIYLAVFVGFVLFGTALHAEESLDDHSVILSGPDCQRVFDQISRRTPDAHEGVWVPTSSQVNRLWKTMPTYVAGPPKLLNLPLESFHRQYVGFVRGGRRFIYLNAFVMRPHTQKYWRDHPVAVGDGGSYFFGIEYDVEKEQLLNFESNGI